MSNTTAKYITTNHSKYATHNLLTAAFAFFTGFNDGAVQDSSQDGQEWCSSWCLFWSLSHSYESRVHGTRETNLPHLNQKHYQYLNSLNDNT